MPDEKAKPKPKRRSAVRKPELANVLSDAEHKFCTLLAQGATPLQASIQVGWHENHGYNILKRPRIKKYLAALQARMRTDQIKLDSKQLVKVRAVTRADITDRLLKLADISPEETKGNIAGQVKALHTLAEMGGFIVQRSADMTKTFEGKSEEELTFFAVNGYWPNDVDAGQSGTDRLPSTGTDVREREAVQ